MGEDEVYREGELDNPSIEMIEKRRNIVTKMIDVTSVARKAKPRRYKVILLHSKKIKVKKNGIFKHLICRRV